jgi:hypothetical protein
MRKILWKSDLWPYAVLCGLIALACLALFVMRLAGGESGEAFTMGLISLLALVVTAIVAFTDRSGAIPGESLSNPEASHRWATRLSQDLEAQAWDDSGINPENSDRAKDAMTKDPPPIG